MDVATAQDCLEMLGKKGVTISESLRMYASTEARLAQQPQAQEYTVDTVGTSACPICSATMKTSGMLRKHLQVRHKGNGSKVVFKGDNGTVLCTLTLD